MNLIKHLDLLKKLNQKNEIYFKLYKNNNYLSLLSNTSRINIKILKLQK